MRSVFGCVGCAGDSARGFRSGEGAGSRAGVSVAGAAFVLALPPIMPSLVGFFAFGDAAGRA